MRTDTHDKEYTRTVPLRFMYKTVQTTVGQHQKMARSILNGHAGNAHADGLLSNSGVGVWIAKKPIALIY